MADDLDRARQHQERLNDAAARHRKPESGLEPIGICHNCEREVGPQQRFCDSDCADEWELVLKRRGAV